MKGLKNTKVMPEKNGKPLAEKATRTLIVCEVSRLMTQAQYYLNKSRAFRTKGQRREADAMYTRSVSLTKTAQFKMALIR